MYIHTRFGVIGGFIILHIQLIVSLFIRCTTIYEIWAQPAEMPWELRPLCLECRGFEYHLRQLIVLRKSHRIRCACIVVCLTLFACFFLPSSSSLIKICTCTSHTQHYTCTCMNENLECASLKRFIFVVVYINIVYQFKMSYCMKPPNIKAPKCTLFSRVKGRKGSTVLPRLIASIVGGSLLRRAHFESLRAGGAGQHHVRAIFADTAILCNTFCHSLTFACSLRQRKFFGSL